MAQCSLQEHQAGHGHQRPPELPDQMVRIDGRNTIPVLAPMAPEMKSRDPQMMSGSVTQRLPRSRDPRGGGEGFVGVRFSVALRWEEGLLLGISVSSTAAGDARIPFGASARTAAHTRTVHRR
jgi:hypothetical protein